MQQIVDLQNNSQFQALDVQLVSIARDSTGVLAEEARRLGITEVPLLSDPTLEVSQAYNVLQWAIENGEPSHTFVLVDKKGEIVWIKDYGAPDNPNRTMYVPVSEIVQFVEENLDGP